MNEDKRLKFIKRAKEIHGSKYDYSKVIFVSRAKPVTIICDIHGEFNQTPGNHLAGKGCTPCGRNKVYKTALELKNDNPTVSHAKLTDYKKYLFKI